MVVRKLYNTLIGIGIIADIILKVSFNTKIAAFGPIIFWAISIFGIINYSLNFFKLSNSVKKTKPELYKKYSFGLRLTRNALSENEFLNALNESELNEIDKNKIIFKYLLLCFGLFAVSAILSIIN
jgi:hypothetical protein